MTTIEITRGFEFIFDVPNQYCTLILKSDTEKFHISSIKSKDGKYFLNVGADITAHYTPGIYKFQLTDNVQIIFIGDVNLVHDLIIMVFECDIGIQ